jgi:hypothetical protein
MKILLFLSKLDGTTLFYRNSSLGLKAKHPSYSTLYIALEAVRWQSCQIDREAVSLHALDFAVKHINRLCFLDQPSCQHAEDYSCSSGSRYRLD